MIITHAQWACCYFIQIVCNYVCFSVVKDLCVNHITHTGFEVYWSKVAHTDYIRGYNLTVISEGKPVFKETVPPSGATEYNRKISCLTPGKQYIVTIDALYSFQPALDGYFKVSDGLFVSTPKGKSHKECVGQFIWNTYEVSCLLLCMHIRMTLHHLRTFQ